jgi:hypothetical protein
MSYVERRRFLWILFLAGIALAAAVANSTTLAGMSFDELAQKSSAVARLRCQSSKSYWDGGELWTDTSFEVVERNKGLLGASVTVRMLGGRADGFTSRVDGVPAFRAGEEVYLFLWGKAGEPYRVLGWSQGTFRIIRDARTGAEKITQESSSANFDERTRQSRADVQGGGIRGMGVRAFQEKLRQAIGRGGAAEH